MVHLDKYIYYDGEDYRCNLCDRWFYSVGALEAHCRNTTRHAWCERCERVFRSVADKDKHQDTSLNHWICGVCVNRPDYFDVDDLHRHRINYHHWCSACRQFFENENNLRMHKQTHFARDKECFGCYRSFGSNSAMLIHLEAGTCPSQTDFEEIKDIAFRCYQSRHYTNNYYAYYPFCCPECHTNFTTVSGLFQHAECRPECSVALKFPNSLSKLLNYISHQV